MTLAASLQHMCAVVVLTSNKHAATLRLHLHAYRYNEITMRLETSKGSPEPKQLSVSFINTP